MALENHTAKNEHSQRVSRRGFLAGLGALIAGTYLTADSYSDEKSDEKVPCYEDFKKVLVEKGKYLPRRERALKSYWDKIKTDEEKQKEFLKQKDPENYIKKYLSPENQEKFRKYALSESLPSIFMKIQKPWKYNGKDISDKIYSFELGNALKTFGNATSAGATGLVAPW